MKRSRNAFRHERGFTLAEVLVATAVFIVIFVAALALYDRANRVYATGSTASDLQQNTRVAFEKLVSDLRLAGFDYDRDGIPFSSAAGVNAWQASHTYSSGSVVTPTVNNGFTYQANSFTGAGAPTSGNSGTTEPSWNTTVGGTTTDNQVTWTTQSSVVSFEQPDEQIEYAGNSAITIRANFDFELHKACGNGRENQCSATTYASSGKQNLESAQFPVVTTGNDEIVTYALASMTDSLHPTLPSGANADSVQFYADVPDRQAYPGGRSENLVSIDGVDLCTNGCNNPPYELRRYTLKADGSPQYAVVAQYIRSISYTYYNNTTGTGTPLAFTSSLTAITPPAGGFTSASPASAGGGQYNPITPTASLAVRQYRATIQSIRVNLVGMNATPAEAGYQNPTETTGSPVIGYRTYSLQSLVVPRNLGKIGQRAVQEAAPGAPAISRVCVGWCGIARVEWVPPTANAANGTVEQYVIFYDTVNPPQQEQFVSGGLSQGYVYGLTPGVQYYFQVAALNSFGSSARTTVLQAPAVMDYLAPQSPTGLLISGSGISGEPAAATNEVDLAWLSPAINSTSTKCASCVSATGLGNDCTVGVAPGEIDSYQVKRSTDPNFDPSSAGVLVTNLAQFPKNILVVNQSSATFADKSAVPCRQYYYRVRGVKNVCAANAGAQGTGPGNGAAGQAYTDWYPAAGTPAHAGQAVPSGPPATPQALIPPVGQGMPSSSCGITCTVYLQWPKVTTDNETPPKPMTVQDYVLTRERWKNGAISTDSDGFPNSATINVTDSSPGAGGVVYVAGNPYYTDSGMPSTDGAGGTYQYHYRVQAVLPCTPLPSYTSPPTPDYIYPCPYTGGAVSIGMSNVQTGNGLSYATAWEGDADGSGTSYVNVSGSGLAKVEVLLRDYSGNTIIDLGTQTSGFSFPIQANVQTIPGDLYQMYVISTDGVGCLDIELRYYAEGTASGCCLQAADADPFVVQFTPGTGFFDVFLKNLCGNDLTIQASGIALTWDTSVGGSGLQLQNMTFPTVTGTRVGTGTIGDKTGTVVQSVPAGTSPDFGLTTVAATTSTYRIRVFFNQNLTQLPLKSFCVTYRRPGIDDPPNAAQNCRIYPQPASTFNTCN